METCDNVLNYIFYLFKDKHVDMFLNELKMLKKGTDLESDLDFEIGFRSVIGKISLEHKVTSPRNKKTLMLLIGWLSTYVNYLFLTNIDRYLITHDKIMAGITKEKLVKTILEQLPFGELLVQDTFMYSQFRQDIVKELDLQLY
ncbi:hypothetical protein [Salmon gill poxvirus]